MRIRLAHLLRRMADWLVPQTAKSNGGKAIEYVEPYDQTKWPDELQWGSEMTTDVVIVTGSYIDEGEALR